ncbi:MAG: cytoskeletal protein CcmA (bactofilin family) [Alphaproteobacteria bacterium]|jgi:cytoskeletal protein CcmA (bactofilin family)
MFGRKKDDAPTAPAKGTATPPRIPEAKPLPRVGVSPSLNLRKPIPAQPGSASTSRMADIPGMMPPRSEVRSYGVDGKTLIVGREISLSGQITACDKLVVEGRVEAELDHCRQLDIAPSGFFKGGANIDEAEICGRFEGSLNVQKRLRVRSTARIKGSLSYGQIEVEAGGEISGDIRANNPADGDQNPTIPSAARESKLGDRGE